MSEGSEVDVRGGRRVHWLELFFDLVMVAYVGQVAHGMHGDPGWADALVFFVLLAPAWWAWVNMTLTLNLFGARITPLLWAGVTVAMIAIGVMAAAVPEALTERAWAFAVGNAVIRLVWMLPWVAKRRTIGVPWWRPIAYSGLPAALWLVSAVVPPPAQYVLWAVAIAVEVVLLASLGGQATWLQRSLDVDHLLERVSLLVVIVFGESILATIAELAAHWTLASGVTAALAFLAISLLAWVFFRYASGSAEAGLRMLQSTGRIGALRDAVMYLPFILIAGIALFASGLGSAVAEAGHHLAPGAAVCMAGGIFLFYLASVAESLRYGVPWREVVTWGSAGLVLPWVILPLAAVVHAEAVVAAVVLLIVLMIGIAEVNRHRVRAERENAATAG
ncbi:low temperature requirement protein LtrA [Agromyces ramosus]|uniref:Low temperature requirement protein LtrA n=1 Tax=Agromyces ramosus TaxID=33879 RepID=A0A4Q7ME81_9MICO|nr:low temperature requirement protein A [Agromyces ramosus]RZS66271.1 low temperature requirement protein LtrA [Agromyces ramosus]